LGRKQTLPSPPFPPAVSNYLIFLGEDQAVRVQRKLLRLKMCACLDEIHNEEKRPNLHTVDMLCFQYFLGISSTVLPGRQNSLA